MTTYSAVLIVPADKLADANALGEALGWGPANFSVPLSADGTEPVTHYGLHTTAQQGFVDMLTGAGQGQLPDIQWAEHGLTAAKVFAVLGAMASSIADMTVKWGSPHFEELKEAAGLRSVGDMLEQEEG